MIETILNKISNIEREKPMLNAEISSSSTIDGVEISLSTGKVAKQANGSILLTCGNTVLLATVTMAKQARDDIDFFPLTIEYLEKMYAAGKIPGGFFKREAKPRTGAILAARLIDRPLRPTFPKGLYNDVQVVITVLSYDENFPPESLGITAASAALSVSDIPFNGPVAGALIAKVGEDYIFNPTFSGSMCMVRI
jgi:polyribonucleotide nucleotidyltransferase